MANTVNLKNVDAFCYPIWYRKTYVKVMASRDIHDQERINSEGAFYVEECAPKEKNSVETVCLSDLLEGYEDFLIKMDIEGAEKEIFERGSLDWIERCKVLIIETHERFYPQDDYSILTHQEMITRGFQCELIGENKVYYKQR